MMTEPQEHAHQHDYREVGNNGTFRCSICPAEVSEEEMAAMNGRYRAALWRGISM